MWGLQPRWADSHSELGWGPGELPTALAGARGEAGSWQQGPERVHGESPLCLPLSHSFPKNVPRVYPEGVGECEGGRGESGEGGGAGKLPHLGHLPTACSAAPPCCSPRKSLL